MMNKFTIAAVLAVSVLADKEKYNRCMKQFQSEEYCSEWLYSDEDPVDCTQWAEHPSCFKTCTNGNSGCEREASNDMDWDITWLIGNSAISTSATAALLTAVTLAVI